MRFEIRETVQTSDPEIVLRALEMCSREVSSDVVRLGDRITLQGFGPSPRSKNKHDTTVFYVNSENNETVIQGEVNFQASALLGDTSQQEVVRSKLDELFEQMKAQIHLDSSRVAAYAAARKSTAGVAVADRSEESGAIERQNLELPAEHGVSSVAPETLIEALTAAPDSGWGAAALVAEPEITTRLNHDAAPRYSAVSPEVQDLPSELKGEPGEGIAREDTAGTAHLPGADQATATEQLLRTSPAVEPEVSEEPTWAARAAPYRLRVDDKDGRSRWKQFALWMITTVVALFIAGGTYYLLRSRRDTATVSSTPIVARAGVAATQYPEVDRRKVGRAYSATTDPSSVPVPEPAASNSDLKPWLQSWAASMRTKDANAQAAFYADTMERYLNQRNVGRAAVLRDREATIHMRKGLWTVKMEDIVIERQTGSDAEVHLVKHFIDEPEQSEILESFVPTRLTLKRIGGQWKITSEQDLPSLSVTPWKNKG